MRWTTGQPILYVYWFGFALGALLPSTIKGAPNIAVICGANAPALERFAGSELRRYLTGLYGIDATSMLEPTTQAMFLIGSPHTNSLIINALRGRQFPPSIDGLVGMPAQLSGRKAFILGGEAPRGSLWAVYELVQRWGVHYLISRDLLPPRGSFRFPEIGFHLEPKLKIRQWRVMNEFPFGPASWGIADYRNLIDQLAKLKFNRLFVYIWPHEPFLRYSFRGITRRSSTMFFGARFPISKDMIGRQLFKNIPEFENPAIPFNTSPDEQLSDGIRLLHEIIDYAISRGLKVVVSATLTQFPHEFAPLIPGALPVDQVGALTITPGPNTSLNDLNLNGLARTVLRATANTYPHAARIDLSMPEHRQWTAQYREAWQYLDRQYRVSKITSLTQLLRSAQSRTAAEGGPQRALAEVKGDLVNLYFYDRLIRGGHLLKETRDPNAHFDFDDIAEELYPILDRVLPPNSELVNFIDYTPDRILKRQRALLNVPAHMVPSLLIYTLNDDNIGLLPQLMTHSLYKLTREIIRLDWAGLSTRYWLLGDQGPCIDYLANAPWESDMTPERAYKDYFQATCGPSCVPDMISAMAIVERATTKEQWYGLGFGFPVQSMIMKFWNGEAVPAEMLSVRDDYRHALLLVEQAKAKTPRSRKHWCDYWIGRLNFGIDYITAAQLATAGGAAQARGNSVAALLDARRALEAAKQGISAYAGVAQDQSDRGAIAVLNEYAYGPLEAKIMELAK